MAHSPASMSSSVVLPRGEDYPLSGRHNNKEVTLQIYLVLKQPEARDFRLGPRGLVLRVMLKKAYFFLPFFAGFLAALADLPAGASSRAAWAAARRAIGTRNGEQLT